ncbi:MAG: helicase-related protein [Nitrososphaerota archaeon]
MKMPLPKNWAEIAARDLVEHLRSRTMAGLPHVGVLGPKPLDEPDEPSDIEEDEYTQQAGSEEGDALYPDWKFVPNRMSYQVTVKPVDDSPLIGYVSFYIRIREGCDEDLGPTAGDRPKEYCLTLDELLHAFKKYELIITTVSLSEIPSIQLKVDGNPIQLGENQVNFTLEPDKQKITVNLEDLSDVFLFYEEGKPQLMRQKYSIRYTRTICREQDKIRINAELRNESPRSPRSVIPERKRDEKTGALETERDAVSRLLKDDELISFYSPRLFSIPGLSNNPSGNRYGYLMEVEMKEDIYSSEYPYSDRDAANTVNCIMDDSELKTSDDTYYGKLAFRDYAIFEEEVTKMAPGPSPSELCSELGLDPSLQAVFEQDLQFKNFYLFQAAAIRRILSAMRNPKDLNTIVISARTAGGKTEAFLVPIAQYCIENRDVEGVKALVFYPTKALANDQTNRYIEILYHLNRRLGGRKITLGLLHGDISRMEPEPGTEEEWDLPLSCPKCENGVLRSEENFLRCNKCGEVIDFVKVQNRQLVYAEPPDILITNPDTLIWDLMMRPQNHSIFGRPIFVCNDCKWTYVAKGEKRKCDNDRCKSSNITLIRPAIPRFIVFDEVHMFRGTFGINCSFFISRLQTIIRKYSEQYHSEPSPKFIRIGSTATISNPLEFAEDFFDASTNDVILVPKDEEERKSFYLKDNRDETIRRHHVYIMPYAYNTDSTIGRAIYYFQMRSKKGMPPTRLEERGEVWDQYLQTITFVNSIRSSNNLIALTRRTVANDLPDIKIDGHTTDFDKKSRAKIERAFNRDELHCIFATQTLEVGVDFRRVDVVIINGFPFSFNDYLQRIGRGGRKRDSLVITVCQNWKPIDHYYFSNARKVLRDPTAHVEPIPITRNNVEASKKHARGALFDYIVSETDFLDYLHDFRMFRNIEAKRKDIEDYCIKALGRKGVLPKEIAQCVSEFIEYLVGLSKNELTPNTLFKRFRDTINEKYQLTSLRSTDREVVVEVLWAR